MLGVFPGPLLNLSVRLFQGLREPALLPLGSLLGSQGSVSHQGAAVSSSDCSRLQIILEHVWGKVRNEGESLGTEAGKLSILIRETFCIE